MKRLLLASALTLVISQNLFANEEVVPEQSRFESLSNASAAVMNRSSSRGVPIYAPAVPKSTYPLRRLRPTFPTMPLLNGDEGSQNALAIASRNA